MLPNCTLVYASWDMLLPVASLQGHDPPGSTRRTPPSTSPACPDDALEAAPVSSPDAPRRWEASNDYSPTNCTKRGLGNPPR
jgi:hypothetical protein